MEDIMKKLVAGSLPYIMDYYRDNQHVVVDFMRQQALKEDNQLDGRICDIFEKWLKTL